MSSYAISDIHGCYDQFQNLLNKISPTEDDTIYLLGDYCDRGSQSSQVLKWILEEAQTPVHCLLGNHDEMLRTSLRRDPVEMPIRWEDTWSFNGATQTIPEIIDNTDPDWRIYKLRPWVEHLKPWKFINVNDKPIMLVHAGFDTTQWNNKKHSGFRPDIIPNDIKENLPAGFGTQSENVMLWIRKGWYDYDGDVPCTVVHGHTPTKFIYRAAENEKEWVHIFNHKHKKIPTWFNSIKQEYAIWHYNNRINIDCGCAYGGKLAALKLDDMQEFYVEGNTREL